MDKLFDMHLTDEQVQNVLTTRATVLAQTPGLADEGRTLAQYVTFDLGSERYAVDVAFIEEIQPLKELTLIPCTPDFVVGAVNIRGGILPVIDVKKFFGIPEAGIADLNKVLVIRIGEMHFGILADTVEEVLDLADEDIEPQLATLSGAQEESIKGVSKSRVIILDIEALVNDRRMIIHQDI
ncbi:MAG: chemotaxis protein CheW [Actinomycetota bacterium]|nr:chemotaxis protein CheW [Actinomycetota bacterium]